MPRAGNAGFRDAEVGAKLGAVSDGRSACRCESTQGNCRLFVTSSPVPPRVSWIIAAGSSREARRKLTGSWLLFLPAPPLLIIAR